MADENWKEKKNECEKEMDWTKSIVNRIQVRKTLYQSPGKQAYYDRHENHVVWDVSWLHIGYRGLRCGCVGQG